MNRIPATESNSRIRRRGQNDACSARATLGQNFPAWLAILALLAWSSSVGRAADAPPQPSAKPPTVRVGGIVLKWLRGDKEANYRRLEPLIREAAAHGAQIVCTTECFLDGYAIADKSIPLPQYRALGEPIPQGEYFRKLASLAQELKLVLIAGMLEAEGEQRYNTAALINPRGELIGKYHKQQLEHEAMRNTAGKESPVFETPFGKLGVMICADRRSSDVVKGFGERRADFLICPSGGMFGPKSNDPILQARSKENSKYIVFVHPAEFLVTGPDGTILERTLLGDRHSWHTRIQVRGQRWDQHRREESHGARLSGNIASLNAAL
jgi:predicted amidohydrolase